ncbi:MAG: hypothetical protein U1E87_00335 [Alphaproteobacteria bacterium]
MPPEERFTLERQGDAFVRLDRTNGAMSLCLIEPVTGLTCRLGADERATYEARLPPSPTSWSELRPRSRHSAMRLSLPMPVEKPKGFFELFLARMIHAARRGGGQGDARGRPQLDASDDGFVIPCALQRVDAAAQT